MKVTLALIAILLCQILLWPDFGRAEGALALGLPAGGPYTTGYVFGMATGENDQTAAMQLCQGIDKSNNKIPTGNVTKAQQACKIVAVFNNQCVAVASNGDQTTPASGVGWATAATVDAAKTQALSQCEKWPGKTGPSCTIQASICDDSSANPQSN